MGGDRVSVVLEETLRRYLFVVNSRGRTGIIPFSQYYESGYDSLRRSAMQGFEEDYAGTAAARN
jgi:hypothetical protein